MKKLLAIILVLTMVFSLAACGGGKTETAKPEEAAEDIYRLNKMTLDEIIEEAKSIGRLDTIGMPADWANYGVLFDALTEEYGLEHTDVDMGSAEEIALFKAEKDAPTKSMGEVGQSYTDIVIEEGIVQAYKPTTWDSVPDWAKDEDGFWMMGYTGTMSIMTNVDAVGKEITSFHQIKEDLENGTINYKLSFGDPITGSLGQNVILAAAYAFGGDVNNLEPALQFFQDLAKAGAIDAGEIVYSRYEKGEATVYFNWDYNNIQNIPEHINSVIHIPSDASVASGYITIINRWAPQAAAAALAREWLFSDEGQLNVAACGARPVRDIEIPEGTCAYTIPDAEYDNVINTVEIMDEWNVTCEKIPELWEEWVIPYMS